MEKMALYRDSRFQNCIQILVNKVTFVGFGGGNHPNLPSFDPPLVYAERSTVSTINCNLRRLLFFCNKG